MSNKIKELMTVDQASKWMKVNRQTLYSAIRKGRLKYDMVKNKVYLKKEYLHEYVDTKYSRDHHYDDKFIGPLEASKLLCLSKNQIYGMIYRDRIEYYKKNGMYFIDKQKILAEYGKNNAA